MVLLPELKVTNVNNAIKTGVKHNNLKRIAMKPIKKVPQKYFIIGGL